MGKAKTAPQMTFVDDDSNASPAARPKYHNGLRLP